MKMCTTKSFVQEIEHQLPKLFICERATVVLVHRWKKFLFRIVSDASTGVDEYQKHDIGKGVSGVVALSGNS
jgi:hypothetical protein